ncbi:MAG TPA: hypothetical protein VG144_09840 [Gaiellaceae bacterium]|nr:hypothetical protein [Gaiellaceae bacterium]
MTLAVCWLLFPVVMAALSLGCGLLVERVAGVRLPSELLVPTGFAAIVGFALFATLTARTAPLALPSVLAVAAVGLAAVFPGSLRRADRWAVVTAVGVFVVFAAPVAASGDATFAGYIKLDDTATFLALTDRALEHGRSLEGLAPSSYEATLAVNLPFYPLGSLLPLGIGAELVGQDLAWVFQPYLAFLAALLGLSLYRLSGVVLESRRARAAAAFVAAQAALLYGYSLWGGVKEVAAAALVALAAALAGDALRKEGSLLALLPLGVCAAALVGVLSIGAAVWLAPVALAVGLPLVRRRTGLRPVVTLAAATALLVPSLLVARLMLGDGVLSSIRDQAELGNLVSSLSALQVFGVWPAGDFRLRPDRMDVTYFLIAAFAVAAVAAVAVAVARRVWELPLYGASVLGGAVVYGAVTSPWIAAKAFAIAAPAVVLMAAAGGLTLFQARRVEGAVAVGVIALGVGWSNALAFGDVTLAPRDQLAELEAIGERFAGQGPALMTEYQPYGVRHFLRELDAEGASELRRRPIPLRDGSMLPKGASGDVAEFRPDALLTYRTLVLRRSPVDTRPAAPYKRVWARRFYEVWQRPDVISVSSTGARRCARPLTLNGTSLSVPKTGRYELWIGGSVRGELTVLVDGQERGRVRHHLNNAGQYTPLGQVELSAGVHGVETRHRLSRFRPGEGGEPWELGPLVVAPVERCS